MRLAPLANGSMPVVAVIYGALLAFAAAARLFGIVIVIYVALSLSRYGYLVLRTIAQGRRDVPAPDWESTNPFTEAQLVLHCAFFLGAVVLFATTPYFGDGAGAALRWIGLALLFAAWPASAAIMSFTSNVAAALHPTSIAQVATTLGVDYGRLLGACLVLALVVGYLPAALGDSWLASAVIWMAAVWAYLAAFALVGETLHEHRDDFDLPMRADDEEYAAQQLERGRQAALDRAYASIRSGLTSEGFRTIDALIAAENDGIDVQLWLFDRMLGWENRSHALELAGRVLARLVRDGHDMGALDLIAQCRRASPDFVVPADIAARLAPFARGIGRHAIADDLAAASRLAVRAASAPVDGRPAIVDH